MNPCVLLPLNSEYQELERVIARFGERGHTPATSSNFSLKLSCGKVSVTRSGADKRALKPWDFVLVDKEAQVQHWHPKLGDQVPQASAETGIHLLIYETFSDVFCVLHAHPITLTAHSKNMSEFAFSGWELQKGFHGVSTHLTSLVVPVYENDQDIGLWVNNHRRSVAELAVPCFVLRGHGIYAWGKSVREAERHLEACLALIEMEVTAS